MFLKIIQFITITAAAFIVSAQSLTPDPDPEKSPEKNPVTDQCIVKFDGCNTCRRSPGSGPWICTRMLCIENKAEYCKKYKGGKTDGGASPILADPKINKETKILRYNPFTLERSPETPVTDQCIVKFTGCNTCRRSSGSGPWICTRMRCMGGKSEYCKKYKGGESLPSFALPPETNDSATPIPPNPKIKKETKLRLRYGHLRW